MTVTKEMVELVSPFTVGASGDFTDEDFEQYKEWAEEELIKDNPGLPESKYDEAWANLICHIFLTSKEKTHIKSEDISSSNYKYTLFSEDEATLTKYLKRYYEIIDKWGKEEYTAGGISHEDSTLPDAFQLDYGGATGFDFS